MVRLRHRSGLASRKFRRFIAAAFVVVLVFEWASHGMAYANASLAAGEAAYSTEADHEDPCKTLVRCHDGRRQDQKTPSTGIDFAQHNALFDRISRIWNTDRVHLDPDLPYPDANALFRPPSSLFHPPEVS